MKKAVILLSGGLDSVTALALAKQDGFACYALSIAYGQRHHVELDAARRVAKRFNVIEHKILELNLSLIGGSALTDMHMEVPTQPSEGIPVTYVPARNTLFLSLALAWAEVLDAQDIFIGVNAVDYSGYPDCRPEFVTAFETLANLATRAGVQGRPFHIHAPLLDLSKSEIIRQGMALGVDYGITVSCYSSDSNGRACGMCDSCRLRKQGFLDAGIPDPTVYF
jgi:7-cyano-7-deazaguanine synthase